jgi:hypothetical protein
MFFGHVPDTLGGLEINAGDESADARHRAVLLAPYGTPSRYGQLSQPPGGTRYLAESGYETWRNRDTKNPAESGLSLQRVCHRRYPRLTVAWSQPSLNPCRQRPASLGCAFAGQPPAVTGRVPPPFAFPETIGNLERLVLGVGTREA